MISLGASFNVFFSSVLNAQSYLPHSLTLLFLQGAVQQRKVSAKYIVLIARI